MKFLLTAFVALTALLVVNSESVAQGSLGGPSNDAIQGEPKAFLGTIFGLAEDGETIDMQHVFPNSPAAEAGLQSGDSVLKADGRKITKVEKLVKQIAASEIGDTLELTIRRNGKRMVVSVVLQDNTKFRNEFPTKGLKANKPKTAELKSGDGLKVTFDAYDPYGDNASTILMCHQAGWSRGEYQEIAPKLNEMGFNCMAIDQRSGGSVNKVQNETNKRAAASGKGVAFVDAEQDIVAALRYLRERQPKGKKLILWGSSYSAALSLRIAGEHPELVDGVLAFAPGEYFGRLGKPGDWIETSAGKIACPAFVTSAKNELNNWKSIYAAIPGEAKTMFLPKTKGNHGSRALWEKFDDHDVYWEATTGFLSQFVGTE